MRKTLVIIVALLALVAAGCGKSKSSVAKGPTGPQTYAIDVDAAASPQFQVGAYFPGVLKVRPGDSIVFDNKSTAHPHTVSFGVKPDNSNAPAPVINNGKDLNPAHFGPCFSDAEPTAALTACPTPSNPAAPPAYAGKGFWTSGLIAAQGAPAKSIKMTLADSIAPGTYSYKCFLHAFMGGVITVVAKDTDRLSPTAVRASAESAAAAAITETATLTPPAATPGVVTAGWGNRVTAVMGFDPTPISIKVGDTVTWKDASPYEPHTVTFQSPFKSPADPGATAPLGVKSGGTYTSGATSSGIFGPAPFFPSATFSLKFTKAGTYNYVCVLHPGMAGVVTVA